MTRLICLDRDGVVNQNPPRFDYIMKPYKFKFIPGTRRAVKLLTEAGFDIVVTSNQAGVARGLFTNEDLNRIDKKMRNGINRSGGRIRKSFYCLHHPDAGCECRKPKIGLIQQAIGNKKIDIENSYFIGDTERDTETGKRFGLKTIAVLTGYCQKKDIKKWKVQPDYIAKDLLFAVKEIVLPIATS